MNDFQQLKCKSDITFHKLYINSYGLGYVKTALQKNTQVLKL